MSLRNQSKALERRLSAIPAEIVAELRPALIASGEELAAKMRALAEGSRDTGALIETITLTGPGETTPAYASGGGKRVANANQVLVTAGSPEVRHGHFVEFGTATIEAQPFMRPAFRLARARIMRRLNRAIGRAIKTAGQSNA